MTIKDKVVEAKELLHSFTTHTELREFAICKGMNSATGFSNFKKALLEIGICYDTWKKNGKPVEGIANISTPEEDSPLKRLAVQMHGNLWEKGGKRRIYVSGGNNYHYDGKWHVEFDDDGDYEAKVWLNMGNGNKKADEYKIKHLKEIMDNVADALEELGFTKDNLAIFETAENKALRITKEKELQVDTEIKRQQVRTTLTQVDTEEQVSELVLDNNEETPW